MCLRLQLPLGLWMAAVIIFFGLSFDRVNTLAKPFASTAMAHHVLFHTGRLRVFATDLVFSTNATYKVKVESCLCL